jgi:Transposase, Mutator family
MARSSSSCLATAREGFEPQIVAKGQTRLDGFDDRIISLYARGLSVREIQAHLLELYAVEVSPDLISRVTDAVLEEVREWQNRPLGDPQDDLHDECGGKPQSLIAQNHQDPGQFPER